MPKNTKVHHCYDKLIAKGYSKAKAARVCQVSTGQALSTGRPPKHKGKK